MHVKLINLLNLNLNFSSGSNDWHEACLNLMSFLYLIPFFLKRLSFFVLAIYKIIIAYIVKLYYDTVNNKIPKIFLRILVTPPIKLKR